MSWDSYLDNLAGHCAGSLESACIISLDGGAPWTTDAHPLALKLQGSEGANIARYMKSNDFTPAQAGGIIAGGLKFQFLRGEESPVLVLGKKKDNGAITIQASKTAIVIGKMKEGQQHANVNKGVGVIAEYLESLGM